MLLRRLCVLEFLLILVFSLSLSAEAAVRSGEAAPNFSLPDIYGNQHSLQDFKGKPIILEWTNYQCPFVGKHYNSGNMQALQKEFTGKGVTWLSINSSAPGKQGYFSTDEWQRLSKEKGAHSTHILLDPKGDVGRLYGAKTTPHMFIINSEGTIIYQGAIDSIRSADKTDIPKATNYVRQGMSELNSGQAISEPVTQSYGCSVKY